MVGVSQRPARGLPRVRQSYVRVSGGGEAVL